MGPGLAFTGLGREWGLSLRVLELPETAVLAMRYTGPYGPQLGRFWDERFQPWLFVRGLLEAQRFGVALDNPTRTPPEACRYDCCVCVPEGMVADAHTRAAVIAGGSYAATDFYGHPSALAAAWALAWQARLPPGYRVDPGRPAFEHYPPHARYDAVTGEFACQICLPVLPH